MPHNPNIFGCDGYSVAKQSVSFFFFIKSLYDELFDEVLIVYAFEFFLTPQPVPYTFIQPDGYLL